MPNISTYKTKGSNLQDLVDKQITEWFDNAWYTTPDHDIDTYTDSMRGVTNIVLRTTSFNGKKIFTKAGISDEQIVNDEIMSIVNNTVDMLMRQFEDNVSYIIDIRDHRVIMMGSPSLECRCERCKESISVPNYHLPLQIETHSSSTESLVKDVSMGNEDSEMDYPSFDTVLYREGDLPETNIKEWIYGYYAANNCDYGIVKEYGE